MADTQLRQNVIDELEFEPSVHSARIGVAVEDGVVTLSGHVRSYAEKLAAERAARRVRGVRAIVQDIHVRYPDEKKTADDEIANRALSIIKWDAMTPADAIKVVVQNGWVTLSGEVDWQYQRKAAENAVRKLSGVTQAVARRAKVEADAIRINVHDGNRVAREGIVESWDERDAVQDAAWSVAGVQSVDDPLIVR
jgi:osmotically-inducible protein OsmY